MASMLLRGFSQNIPTGSGSCGLQGSSEILVEYKLLSLSVVVVLLLVKGGAGTLLGVVDGQRH